MASAGSGRDRSFPLNLSRKGAIMAISEEARYALHRRLEEMLGPEEATILMEHLPPVGWADVATKHDLAHLEQRLEQRFELLESRLEGRLQAGLNRMMLTTISAMI